MGAAKELQILLDEAGVDYNAYFGAQRLADDSLKINDALMIARAAYVLHETWGSVDIELSDFDLEAAWKLFQADPGRVIDLSFQFVQQQGLERYLADEGL